ncbi:MAG: 2-hydroxyglutaryl-CoA dehydratase, partial [Desulfobacteraceae bacterium]
FSSIRPSLENSCTINSMCAVFAETEIISLLAKEMPVEAIASGINTSFAQRIAGLARRMRVNRDVLFVGGVAKNDALKQSVAQALDIEFAAFDTDPQLMGALGAAVYASQL